MVEHRDQRVGRVRELEAVLVLGDRLAGAPARRDLGAGQAAQVGPELRDPPDDDVARATAPDGTCERARTRRSPRSAILVAGQHADRLDRERPALQLGERRERGRSDPRRSRPASRRAAGSACRAARGCRAAPAARRRGRRGRARAGSYRCRRTSAAQFLRRTRGPARGPRATCTRHRRRRRGRCRGRRSRSVSTAASVPPSGLRRQC